MAWFGIILLGVGLVVLLWNHDGGTIAGVANDDFARLVALSALAAVIGAGVLYSYRGRFGKAAKDAAIWIAIAFGLVALYAYRDDLIPVANRTVGALVPGTAVDGERAGTVVIQRAGDGHFHVNGRINGAPVRMIVDTGASSLVLTRDDAIRAGLNVDRLSYSQPVSTANGVTTAAPVLIDRVDLGSLRVERVRALVAREGVLFSTLLGMNVLDRIGGLSVDGDRMVLGRS